MIFTKKYWQGSRFKLDQFLNNRDLLPPQNWQSISPVFIVSTGRTGTRFLADFFKSLTNIWACHEPHPDMVKLSIEYAQKLVLDEEACRLIEQKRRAICREVKRNKASMFIESNNRLFSLVKPIKRVFPHAKIIHIVRDGRDFVRSGMSRNWYNLNDHHLSLRLKATMFPDDPYCNLWEDMSKFEKVTYLWQKTDNFIYQDVQSMDSAITVRFEDIFKHPDRVGLFKIGDFLGLSSQELELNLYRLNQSNNATTKHEFPHWSKWTPEMQKSFDEMAGDHMTLYYKYP